MKRMREKSSKRRSTEECASHCSTLPLLCLRRPHCCAAQVPWAPFAMEPLKEQPRQQQVRGGIVCQLCTHMCNSLL